MPFCFIFSSSFAASQQIAEISGEVEKIKYKQFVNDNLRETKLENFDINKASGALVLNNGKEKIAVSRWISPKRTRSYPYERVYDTLAFPKRVTIIPVLKDEGLGGERDFLQWDTISLLSLLDVHVILAYYNDATKKLAYRDISKNTKTYLHDEAALNELIKYTETPQKFIEFSRRKSQNAQIREQQTKQPKEALATDTKQNITITNALFGKYFFTVDETRLEPKTVYLIEAKHSQRSKFTHENDIKDALVKMMVYTNLKNVRVSNEKRDFRVVLKLTTSRLNGSIDSSASDEELNKYCSENLLDFKQKEFIKKLFTEARTNNFTIIIEKAETKNRSKSD
ncbi:MAG: hypothetical protein LC768_13455 [Acidobacteria bacterium]|nr:hypothetical protein [Acidobacteriota bacterium]